MMELDSEIEESACQLWDMTVERDVSLHLLNMEEIDILQLSAHIITHSKAPRLTEVVTGNHNNSKLNKNKFGVIL